MIPRHEVVVAMMEMLLVMKKFCSIQVMVVVVDVRFVVVVVAILQAWLHCRHDRVFGAKNKVTILVKVNPIH